MLTDASKLKVELKTILRQGLSKLEFDVIKFKKLNDKYVFIFYDLRLKTYICYSLNAMRQSTCFFDCHPVTVDYNAPLISQRCIGKGVKVLTLSRLNSFLS